MITSAGVGSGLDIESIITELMAIERQPIINLESKQARLDVSISALGTLKSALSELESSAGKLGDTTKFGNYLATSSDDDVFTAESTPGTRIENHNIEVLSLAQAHQIATDAYPDGPESAVATGTYSFSSGEESFDVVIDGSNNSLLAMRDAINDSEDNTTISASVLNLEGGSRLILTARQSGVENQIQASGAFTEITPAEDASIIIDGFPASSATNEFSDVIPGINLQLQGVGTGRLETSRNTESFREVLDEFVTNYNALISNLDDLAEGDLSSDGTLRSIKSDLSRMFFESIPVKGEEYSPSRLGLSFDEDGVLSVSETAFSEVSLEDTENFVLAMTDPEVGFSQRVEAALDKFTAPDGILAAKEDSFEARKDNYLDQTERLEYRLEQTEARLRRQFTSLDTLMSRLQTTSNYLTDQLASLNAGNG